MLVLPSSYHRVAVVLAPRLGDSLLLMVLAQNLRLAGKEVVVFGNYPRLLAPWFPDFDLRPALEEATATQSLQEFELVLHMHVGWPLELRKHHARVVYYDEIMAVTGRGIVKLDQIALFCKRHLGLGDASTDNGLRDIERMQYRRYANRVVIHPSSTSELRRWAPERFMELGLALKQKGFEPVFIVGPEEYDKWAWIKPYGLEVPEFPSLAAIASFIHASGWLIGNESGIGHLASNLGIPTLWFAGRGKRARMWRPAWSPARVIYPWFLPTATLRDRFWREVIPVSRVMAAFAKLRKTAQKQLRPPLPAIPPVATITSDRTVPCES